MEYQVIIDTDKVGLYYYPVEKIVHHQIRKFVYGDDFRSLLIKGLEIFIANGCKKWLSDDFSNSALKKEDVEWGDLNWKPKVIEAGWKYWALVMPKMVIGQMNMKPLVQQYSDAGITVKIFDNSADGLKWLKGAGS